MDKGQQKSQEEQVKAIHLLQGEREGEGGGGWGAGDVHTFMSGCARLEVCIY